MIPFPVNVRFRYINARSKSSSVSYYEDRTISVDIYSHNLGTPEYYKLRVLYYYTV